MNRSDEFRLNAVECQEQAAKLIDPPDRQHWLKLAEHWRKLADAIDENELDN
jgi:hypothetical protein